MPDVLFAVSGTITIPEVPAVPAVPAQIIPVNFELDLTTLAAALQPLLASPPPIITPPVTKPTGSVFVPPAGALVIYANGTFDWPGDYSWGVAVNYKDTVGVPESGDADIAITGIGGFQPFAPGTPANVDLTPYGSLNFDLKPTIANQTWNSGWEQVGDVVFPGVNPVSVTNFGPAPQVGKWATYKIPLFKGGYGLPAGAHAYKFMLQDNTADQNGNTTPNVWYIDNIYLSVS